MRRGLATAAYENGVPVERIMKQGGWSRLETVLGYIQRVDLHKNNPGEGLL